MNVNWGPIRQIALRQRPVGDAVEQVRIDTRFLPPIIINRPLDDTGTSGPPSRVMTLLKPQITITSPILKQTSVRAPYGVPGPTQWPKVRLALIGLSLVGAYGLYRIGSRLL